MLMKQRPRKDSWLSIPRYPLPDYTLVTATAPAGFYSPVDIHWIHLSIDIHSCSLFASLSSSAAYSCRRGKSTLSRTFRSLFALLSSLEERGNGQPRAKGKRQKVVTRLFFEGSGGVLVRINDEGILVLFILRDKSTLPSKHSQRLVYVFFLIYKDGCGNHHDCQPRRGVENPDNHCLEAHPFSPSPEVRAARHGYASVNLLAHCVITFAAGPS